VSSQPPSAAKRPGELVSRVVAGLAAAGLFVGLAWADAIGIAHAPAMAWLAPLVLLNAAGAGREVVMLANPAGIGLSPWLVPLGAAVIAASPVLGQRGQGSGLGPLATLGPAAAACMAVVTAAFTVGVASYQPAARGAARAAGSTAAAVMIGLPIAFMVALRLQPVNAAASDRLAPLMPIASLIAVVKAGDIAAYVVGSMIGRHRMAPLLSPGKTWEGAAASLAASIAVACLFFEGRSCSAFASRPLGGWLLYGTAVGAAGMVGDLAESLVKRDLGAKDSGRLLGGMGGCLDLIDSLLLAAPVAWLLWVLG